MFQCSHNVIQSEGPVSTYRWRIIDGDFHVCRDSPGANHVEEAIQKAAKRRVLPAGSIDHVAPVPDGARWPLRSLGCSPRPGRNAAKTKDGAGGDSGAVSAEKAGSFGPGNERWHILPDEPVTGQMSRRRRGWARTRRLNGPP